MNGLKWIQGLPKRFKKKNCDCLKMYIWQLENEKS
jgi:hypothetical protein